MSRSIAGDTLQRAKKQTIRLFYKYEPEENDIFCNFRAHVCSVILLITFKNNHV